MHVLFSRAGNSDTQACRVVCLFYCCLLLISAQRSEERVWYSYRKLYCAITQKLEPTAKNGLQIWNLHRKMRPFFLYLTKVKFYQFVYSVGPGGVAHLPQTFVFLLITQELSRLESCALVLLETYMCSMCLISFMKLRLIGKKQLPENCARP